MKFNKSISLIIIAAQTLLVRTEKVTFKVLAVNGTPFVKVGDQQVQMTLEEYPLYKAEVDVQSFPVTYNYGIVNGGETEEEEFQRTREKDQEVLNEFFKRSVTKVEHPKLPRAYKAYPSYVPSKLFDDTHVATIVIKCDQNLLNELYKDPENSKLSVNAEVVYATPKAVKTFKNAELDISGQSTRNVGKLSYKIKKLKTDNNKELYNRTAIKLRAEHMDPSFLRDKIYGDILSSLGVPAAQNKFARVYINGEAIGLFNLADDITNNRYLRETYNKGEKFSKPNPIFKADYCPTCNPGGYADLGYYGDEIDNPMYNVYTYKGDDKTTKNSVQVSQEVIPLLKEIDNYAKGSSKKFPFEEDTFLKYMAAEFLAGAVDNYWNKPGNFFIFKNAAKNQWHFHDADFHYSFGIGGDAETMLNTPLAEYPPNIDQGISRARPPLDALLSHQENQEKLNDIIERLLKTCFHTGALYPRMESLVSLIKEDVEWDFTLPKVSLADSLEDTDLVYTVDDFVKHTTSLEKDGNYNTIPLRYFISNKISLVSQELGVKVPQKPEDNLGYVEVPSSGSIKSVSWSVFSAIVVLFISYVLY